MIDAYVTNLGRYVEGHLDGEYLKLPATKEDVQALLQRIHVDGVRYEEIFITDYEISVDGLYQHLGEYESIDELNYLAALLEDMPDYERVTFEAATSCGEHTGSVKDLINLAGNLDNYVYYPDIENSEDLGRYYIEELSALNVPDDLMNYFDYEGYGRDIHLNGSGQFCENGYVEITGGTFTEYYDGTHEDIPEEYRIFAYPEPEKASIRDTLRHYQQMIAEAPVPNRSAPIAHDTR